MRINIVSFPKIKSIQYVSIIALLWGLSDALVSFYIPIQMQNFLHNLTLFGFLFGLSSLVGALSDPILGYLSNRIHYTVLLFIGLVLSLSVVAMGIMPFSILLIVWLMIAWGLYYEFIDISIFSYISRYHRQGEQSRTFGVVYLFMNLAYVIGPILGGYVVLHGSHAVYGLCLLCIVLAMAFMPKIISLHKRRESPLIMYKVAHERYSLKKQLRSYRKVWKYASIFFIAAFLYNVWDAFAWTLVPIQSIGGNAVYAGLIVGAFSIPLALLGVYGGKIADKYGRNATFISGLFVASLFTLIFGLQQNIILKVTTAAISSLGFAFAYPAFMGETAKGGQDHASELGNMAGVQRVFVNGGFIIGPIVGGMLASDVGIQRSFFVLGIAMLICFVPIITAMIHFRMKGRTHKSVLAEFDL